MIGGPAQRAAQTEPSVIRRSEKTATAAAPRPSKGSAGTTIGIKDPKTASPGIGTGREGAEVEKHAAPPTADASAASSPDLVMKRLVPIPTPSQASAAKGVMAYAAQAAAHAAAKQAVAVPAALIEMA